MNSLELLNLALLEDRFSILLAIADVYEEKGETELAQGYRWLAEHKKWPVEYPNAYVWNFSPADARHCLPVDIAKCIKRKRLRDYYHSSRTIEYSFKEAAEAVSRWLNEKK